jgi:hypothetical protein
MAEQFNRADAQVRDRECAPIANIDGDLNAD